MAPDSARLQLPFLEAGQAQKEIFHNEALASLDLAVQPSVTATADAPPPDPAPGDCWIVGPGASGAWAGYAGAIAGWTVGGWRFVVPREGFSTWHSGEGTIARWRSGAWRLDRSPPIPAPNGGSVVDGECRAAVAAILAAMAARGWLA